MAIGNICVCAEISDLAPGALVAVRLCGLGLVPADLALEADWHVVRGVHAPRALLATPGAGAMVVRVRRGAVSELCQD